MGKEQFADLIYKHGVLPLTSSNPERTHDAVFTVLSHLEKSDIFIKVLRREFGIEDRRLVVNAMGIEFPTPILLAGGIVKYGPGACTIAAVGAGGIEGGNFTLNRREGNPKIRVETSPSGKEMRVRRIQRFADGTMINWMALPNPGIKQGTENISLHRDKIDKPIGLNISPTPGLANIEASIEDLRQNLEIAYPFNPSWITLNLSCPNTADSDRLSRIQEAIKIMDGFLKASNEIEERTEHQIPKLVKIGPDMTIDEIKIIVTAAKEFGFAGIVATNTTTDRTGIRKKYAAFPKGGLSGPLLFEKSLATVESVRKFDRELGGEPLVIVACGGIDSIKKLQQMKAAGANLYQVATGFIFGGPYFFKQLNREYISRKINS